MSGNPIISFVQGAPIKKCYRWRAILYGRCSDIPVGLSGSDTAFSYQLLLNGNPVGLPITGNGSALDFGLRTISGNYTVRCIRQRLNLYYTMNDTATVVVDPLPSPNITTPLPDTNLHIQYADSIIRHTSRRNLQWRWCF